MTTWILSHKTSDLLHSRTEELETEYYEFVDASLQALAMLRQALKEYQYAPVLSAIKCTGTNKNKYIHYSWTSSYFNSVTEPCSNNTYILHVITVKKKDN